MNAFTALLWTRSVRFLRLDAAHRPRRPRGFRPRLEDLETRLAPAGGGAGAPLAHLADAARVSPPNPGGATPAVSGDRLDEFWGPGAAAPAAAPDATGPGVVRA